jgi:hypothetical protein
MNLLTRIRLDIIAPVFARLPRFKGKYRLARLILGNSLNVKNRVIKTPDGCQFFVPSLREPVSFGLLINGVYEPDSLELILKKLTKDAVFLDNRLKDYLAGGKPLDGVLVQGFDMLVAVKHGA